MYHIPHDKRAQNSAELIYQGLCQCLKAKTFDHITITDIQEASTVSRATFYRHFDNLSDVLYWRCDQCFKKAWTDYKPTPCPETYSFVYYFLDYWDAHSEILEILLQVNRLDIIYACHIDNIHFFEETYRQLLPAHPQDDHYFMSIRAGIMIGLLMGWLQNNKKETPQELCAIIKSEFENLCHSELFI